MTTTSNNLPGPKPLSPAAQAVLDAYENTYIDSGLVAAIFELADQVVPEEPLYGGDQRWEWECDARQASRKKILAIATELEALQ
jgi:hypothetical protein